MTTTIPENTTDTYTVHDIEGLEALPAGTQVRETMGLTETFQVEGDGTMARLEGSGGRRSAGAWGLDFPMQVLNPEILGTFPDTSRDFRAWELELLGTDVDTVTLEVGDRVQFAEDYGSDAKLGDAGTVFRINADAWSHSSYEDLIYVKLDKGGNVHGVFRHRLRKVEPERIDLTGDVVESVPFFKKGDKVLISDDPKCITLSDRNGPVAQPYAGKVGEVLHDDSKLFGLGNYVVRVENDLGINTQYIAPEHLETYVEPEPAPEPLKVKVGDRVRVTLAPTYDSSEGVKLFGLAKVGDILTVDRELAEGWQHLHPGLFHATRDDDGRGVYLQPGQVELVEPGPEPAFKVGDIVAHNAHWVTGTAVVDKINAGGQQMRVTFNKDSTSNAGLTYYSERVEQYTLVRSVDALKPVAEGDLLTVEQVDELPQGSVVVDDNDPRRPHIKMEDGEWFRLNVYATAEKLDGRTHWFPREGRHIRTYAEKGTLRLKHLPA